MGEGGGAPRGEARDAPQRSMVIKVLDLVGQSNDSWQQAAENALREAAKTVDHITGLELVNLTAEVQDGELTEFRANVKVAFAVDDNRRRPGRA